MQANHDITCDNVEFGYDAARILAGISLRIEAGTACVLVGPSGCGKTTLLKVSAGLISPTRGLVTISGVPPGQLYHANAIAYVSQRDSLLPWRSAKTNIRLARQLGNTRSHDNQTFQILVENLGLGNLLGRLPHRLSGGERQRVALARALYSSPRVLFLDEPMASIDPQTRRSILGFLKKWCADLHITCLAVTHNHDEAVFLADHLVVVSGPPITSAGVKRLDCYAKERNEHAWENPEFLDVVQRLSIEATRVSKLSVWVKRRPNPVG